jgi:hypothetical protein
MQKIDEEQLGFKVHVQKINLQMKVKQLNINCLIQR